jgi:hypothetical protein
VTYRPIARQRLGKHISAGANARNIRTSIARQRISKHTLTIEALFSAWSLQRGYKRTKKVVSELLQTIVPNSGEGSLR